jgi:hypothetical protein
MSEKRALPSLPFRVRRRVGGEIDALVDGLLGRVRRFPNELCLRVFALRRSGHPANAILNWIRYQLPYRHCLLNDCTDRKFKRSFLSGGEVERGRGRRVRAVETS